MPQLLKAVYGWISTTLLLVGYCQAQELENLKPDPVLLKRTIAQERMARIHHDSSGLAEAWFQLGDLYERVGDNQRSEPYFLSILALPTAQQDSFLKVNTYIRLSELK